MSLPKIRRSEPNRSDEPGRAVDRDRHLAAAERERLQHPGQPEVVVGVVVGEEDLAQVDQAERRAEQLALGALGAVEEQALAPAPQSISAVGARSAVGIEPDVPRKTTSRSMPRSPGKC